jgi:hypothetical protein
MVKGKRPKLFYATQVGVAPPTFVFFARDAGSVHFSYRRYLENRLRDTFGYLGTPIRLVFRERAAIKVPRFKHGAPKSRARAVPPRKSSGPPQRGRPAGARTPRSAR